MKKYIFLIGYFIASIIPCFAQEEESNNEEQELVNVPFDKKSIPDKVVLKTAQNAMGEGDYLFDYADFDGAIASYQEAYDINPDNAYLNMQMGEAYLQSATKDHKKSIEFFEKVLKLQPDAIDAYLRLGAVYHEDSEWTKATEYFEKYLNLSPSNKLFQESREAAQKKIQECKNGIFVSQRKANVEIENVGSVINSRFIDYGAVVTPDESTLYFTTTRPGAKGEKDEAGHYPEDIYVSYNENGEWSKPRNIGAPINTEEYESILTVAQEGRKMIFFRQDDLLQSYLGEDGKWSEPEKVFPKADSRFKETAASLSPDGNTLYIVSEDPSKSLGGLDIYECTLQDEKWSKPRNLGPVINTQYDEDAVFMDPDGKTLYFSSKGHSSIGGFDIFKTVKGENGEWSEPENIGIPLNTPRDDLYLVLTKSGRRGYFTSINATQGADIYRVTFLDVPEDEPVEEEIEQSERILLVASAENIIDINLSNPSLKAVENNQDATLIPLKLKVFDQKTQLPLQANVELEDKNQIQESSVFQTKENGVFKTLILSNGQSFEGTFSAQGYKTTTESLAIDENSGSIVLEVGLIKDVAKSFLVDYEIPASKAQGDSTPTLGKIDFTQNAQLIPIVVKAYDNANNQPLAKVNVQIQNNAQENIAQLVGENGVIKTIISQESDAENQNFEAVVSAQGYKTKNEAFSFDSQSGKALLEVKLVKDIAKSFVLDYELEIQPLSITTSSPTLTKADVTKDAALLPLVVKVYDEATNQLIPNSNIQILNSSEEEITQLVGENGVIKTVLSQENISKVVASAAGYTSQSMNIQYDAQAKFDIKLKKRVERLFAVNNEATELEIPASFTQPEVIASEISEDESVGFFGAKVVDNEGNLVPTALVQIIDLSDNNVIKSFSPNKSSGKFLIDLPKNYLLQVLVEAEGYLFFAEKLQPIGDDIYKLQEFEIVLNKIESGASITLKNVIFKQSSTDIVSSSFPELNRLVKILKDNPKMTIEIGGHTDFVPGRNKEGLMELSELRATSVKDYLVTKGINATRFDVIGYGPTQPIVSNDDPTIRYLNRRVEFKILSNE